ncbi:N-acetyltransferase [Synechocystis sp. PCC 7509]|uniref:N-acetyltransferase n=1 Tax=Synechocystis sp. PCC 7509 TaxID=927677 RepID=UPI0002ACBA64|nr:N-acetyltransferase [Synechocystis sp. PCC 7509]
MGFKIELFESRRHSRSGFCCGIDSLDSYVSKQASQDLKRRVSTVFVLINEPETNVLAYYTLSSYTVEVKALNEDFAKNLPRYPLLPATLLGRLAVDNKYKGNRFGELLLVDALKKSLDVSLQIASLAVVAESLDEKASGFYLKYGFQQFKQDPLKLYLPMKSIAKLCAKLSI